MSSLTGTLSATLALQSPRLNPRRVPLASQIISILVPLVFVGLLIPAFSRQGLAVWSLGVAYILYDTALLLFTAWNIRNLRPAPRSQATRTGTETLAVIMAAHNEAGVIVSAIDSLIGQSRQPEMILIADDGSNDATPGVLKARFGLDAPALGTVHQVVVGPTTISWLRLPHGGKATALNAAIQMTTADIVLTVDADTLLEAGAIVAMRDAFATDPTLVAATGVLSPTCGPDLEGRLFAWFQSYEYVRNFLSRHAWGRLNSLLLISGAFAAFRRSAVIEVGGFDPDCLVEDYELIHRIHRHSCDQGLGWRVGVVGAAMARTDAPATVPAFLRQRRRWFGGFLQTQYWNRDMVGNSQFGRLGLLMLPVKALDTLQPVFGLTAFAILIWVVASGRFYLALPILLVMVGKIVIDLIFHLWSLGIYRRWTGQGVGLALGPALIAAVAEPFSFQLLRHLGAVMGWLAFLGGREKWGRQTRTAIPDLVVADRSTV